MKRRALAFAALPAAGWPCAAVAAKRDSATRHLGVLLFDTPAAWAFLQRDLPPALARLGWQQGRQLSLDWQFALGDAAQLPALAGRLIEQGCNAILTRGTPCTRALQQATRTVPIATGVGDPVGAGFAQSLRQPGGNITGLSYAMNESVAKQLELLRELAPRVGHLVYVNHDSRRAFAAEQLAAVQRHAQSLRWTTDEVWIESAASLRQGLARALQGRPSGSVGAFVNALSGMDPKDAALAPLHAGVPAVFDQRAYVDSGGLLSYRLNWDDQTGRTARQLDRLLRGADPATMPFELPTHSECVVNARSARLLGLAVTATVRARADEVIE